MDKIYCYPDTSILKNKLDIHDKNQLLTAETSLVAVRLYQLYQNPIKGNFDYSHLCHIHYHIFQDLYSWAGETRTVNIAKTSLFCLVQFIQNYAKSIFPAYYNNCMRAKDKPEEFIHIFTKHYADLNALHPFREGNGRSQREFAREICLKCGYSFDLRHTKHEEMLSSSIESLDKGNNAGLEAIFKKCITPLPL